MTEELCILFEDNHCLAVAKPAGLLTQGVPEGLPTLEGQVRDYLRTRYAKKGRVYLGVPHRLDRPVSGVVLFARQTKSAQRLAEQFRQRQVRKIYWAAVDGEVQPGEGTWQDWMCKVPEEARATLAAPDAPQAKLAVLHYRRLQARAGCTLLEIVLETGRMHQIRLQASVRGHPVTGDALYGSACPFGPADESPRGQHIALHAHRLTFLHPVRYEPVEVIAPLPPAWAELGWPGARQGL